MVGGKVFLARKWREHWLIVANPWWGRRGPMPPPRWRLHHAPIEDEV